MSKITRDSIAARDEPLKILASLVERNVSGELICASPEAEIHVFLKRGRIAWAIDSRRPAAFADGLVEIDLDAETLREVIETCRRENLPLGETLVGWGLLSWEGCGGSCGRSSPTPSTCFAPSRAPAFCFSTAATTTTTTASPSSSTS